MGFDYIPSMCYSSLLYMLSYGSVKDLVQNPNYICKYGVQERSVYVSSLESEKNFPEPRWNFATHGLKKHVIKHVLCDKTAHFRVAFYCPLINVKL
jgi:hypothetical protein